MKKYPDFDLKDYGYIHRIEKLKSVPRQCVTADNVVENVAAHSWRTAMMAFLVKDQFPHADMDKVIKMCLIHDIGEAVTGDIPTFEKREQDELTEQHAIQGLLALLPDSLREELTVLFAEMDALETEEALQDKCVKITRDKFEQSRLKK